MRIVLTLAVLVGCRGKAEFVGPPAPQPVIAGAGSPSAPAPASAPAPDPRGELTALCRAASAKLPGWLTPIPETPDGSWPEVPPSALSKRRLTGRCDDASPEVHAALRTQLLPRPDANTRPPTHFDVCVQDKRFLVATFYSEDASAPDDYADRWMSGPQLQSVAMVAGKPIGKPTHVPDEAGPFADFDGDGVPELATWRMRYDPAQRLTYTITVWFAHGKQPVVWSHTVATSPSRLSFVTAAGRPALLFSPTGLDDDWFAPSDIEVFAVAPDGVKPVPDAAAELWQFGEPERRLRWGQSACVDPVGTVGTDGTAGTAEPPATAGFPAVWWERHLVALGASPERARLLAASLVTPAAAPAHVPAEPPDSFDQFASAIRSKRGQTCARPDPAVRAAFERDRTAALVALAEARGAEIDAQPAYTWGCTTHGETLVAIEYGPALAFFPVGLRGSEIWSVHADGPAIRQFSAIDPRSHHHNGNDVRYPSYFLRIAGYGDFDGDGTLEALLQLGYELDRSHRYFDGYAIWDGSHASELALTGAPWSNGVVVDPLLLEIVDGAKPASPSLIVRLDDFADACRMDHDPERCDWTLHPPPILRWNHDKLVPATKGEVAAVVADTAQARAELTNHP